jgi:hypothetical protein
MLPPVIIVDDDEDEHDLMKEVWKELFAGNKSNNKKRHNHK